VRGLKSLVIVLGVLLVGGMAALVAAIAWRGTHRPPDAVGSDRAAATGRVPFDSVADLPPGADVIAVEAAGERLVVQLRLGSGARQLVIFDLRSGTRLGTIELRPQP
jgi:hypothetical protein